MGKCNITTWKFKELPLQNPQRPEQSATTSNSGNSYLHNKDNELFLVGYKYINQNSCPEVKIKLSDIMQGGNGDGSECECELALRYDNTEHKLYYSLDGDTQDSRTNWVSLAELDSSFGSVEFNWLPSNGTATASVGNNTLHLSLPVPTGSGGGNSTLPSDISVVVTQLATTITPTGSFEDGVLTLNLVPGAQGPKGDTGARGAAGRDGVDGASFKLYKVKLDFVSNQQYEQKGVTDGITVYKLNANQTWYKYEPNSNTYTQIKNKPTIGNAYVEIGPSDIWKTGNAWDAVSNYYIPGLNARFNTFGFYDYTNQTFEFYSAGDPTTIGTAANSPLQFSVKVYENIKSANDEPTGSGDDPVTPDDPQPSTPGYYYTEDGIVDHKVSLYTNENLPQGIVRREGDNVYYLQSTKFALYDGDTLLVYIPNDKKIDKVYGIKAGTWEMASDENHLDYWELKDDPLQIGENDYKIYGYKKPQGNSFGGGVNNFSFDIIDDSSNGETPYVSVSEHNTDGD